MSRSDNGINTGVTKPAEGVKDVELDKLMRAFEDRVTSKMREREKEAASRKWGASLSAAFGAGDDGPPVLNLQDYWRMLVRHRLAVLLTTLLIFLLALAYVLIAKPVYKAEVTLAIEPGLDLMTRAKMTPTIDRKYFFKTQEDIITSNNVVSKVVKRLKLDKNPEFESKPSLFGGGDKTDQDVIVDGGKFFVSAKLKKLFLSRLDFSRPEISEVASIGYESHDPRLAAEIANAVAQAYLDVSLETQLDETRQATRWLKENMKSLRAKLANSESVLRKFKREKGLVDLKNVSSQSGKQLESLTTELVKAKADRALAEVVYEEVVDTEKKHRGYGSLSAVINNPLIQKLKQDQVQQQRKVSQLSERYLAKHPKIIQAKSDLAEATRRLNGEVAKVVSGIKRDYKIAKAREKEIQDLLSSQKSEMRLAAGDIETLARLEQDVKINRELYGAFLKRFKETNTTNFNKKAKVHIIDEAYPPVRPFKPKKKVLLPLALLLGLLSGFALALVRERMDSTFKLPEDVENKLHLPLLGMAPQLAEKNRQMVLRNYANASQSPFAEAINGVRTGIMFSEIDNPPKSIMLTSAQPDEGKTTTSSNLALAFSKLGRTLLIDADMRKPALAEAMGLSSTTPGLSNFIAGHKKFHECIVKDKQISNFYFMPSGSIPPNPLEMLSSKRFESMMGFLHKAFDHIIIDCPPLLQISDALVIGQVTDCLVLVVKAHSTPDKAVKEAMRRLQSAKLTPVGVVLSQMDVSKLSTYAGYEYYGARYA